MHDKPDTAFAAAVEPLRGALRLHCYRMLGSSHDGEDIVQETLLRAWRAWDTLSDPAMLRPWLYRIATNACLDELKSRPRRVLAHEAYPPTADPRAPIAARIEEPVWLEPMPDTWLQGADERDPAARYALKESVALAFVASLQMLSAVQRATLLLRDVVGLSAEETADALGISVSAANSALFRARTTVEEKLGARVSESGPRDEPIDEALLARYVAAFEEANMDSLVALLHEDVKTTMPPSPTWIAGRAANEAFYRHMFGATKPGTLRHLRISANGQPAFAFYRPSTPCGRHALHAIQLVTIRDGKVWSIDHFMISALFGLFGVPRELS
jgi:RNA polymerase sigma-70 factor (ECF subfamily)